MIEKVSESEEMAETWDKGFEDTELQNSGIEVPQSPTPSAPSSDATFLPSSDAGIEATNVSDSMMNGDKEVRPVMLGVGELDQGRGPAERPKRKLVKTLEDEGSRDDEPPQKQRKRRAEDSGDEDSDDEGSEGCGLRRSADASQKLNEAWRLGTLVVDEGKRERFEKNCHAVDKYAMFRYKKTTSWQVRHSKCSKWVAMREPYDLVRFREHVNGCKRMGEEGRNGTIDLFFSPQATKSKPGIPRLAKPSARKQTTTQSTRTKSVIKPDLPSIAFVSAERPCLGLGKEQDERITTYLSRVLAEGAGSCSDKNATAALFGDGVKYSELDECSKRYVAAAQVHMQKWKISHTLGVVFSADCKGKLVATTKSTSSACDQCLSLLKLDVFKKALAVKPPPLKNLKYTTHRCRTAATSLGINLAKIEGVSDLLEKVSCRTDHKCHGLGLTLTFP